MLTFRFVFFSVWPRLPRPGGVGRGGPGKHFQDTLTMHPDEQFRCWADSAENPREGTPSKLFSTVVVCMMIDTLFITFWW